MTDLFITVITLGFFATIIALVAIAYRQTGVAKDATKILAKLLPKTKLDKPQE
jgi:uncharacterized membrane protein